MGLLTMRIHRKVKVPICIFAVGFEAGVVVFTGGFEGGLRAGLTFALASNFATSSGMLNPFPDFSKSPRHELADY